MAPQNKAASSASSSENKKRKDPPQSSSNSQKDLGKGHGIKRVKTGNFRTILTQTTDAALNNGELDLQSFLNAREFEIKALQDGMERSKNSRTTRAFQEVPRDMRRRTASHNVKRVPKRMQKRAAREMKGDNTPTVASSKRKPGSSRGRIRAETAKRLGILAEKKRATKAKNAAGGIDTRAARPKIRKDKLNDPPKAKSKFRKRQIHKTWLPTHMWHAKRARMTEPKNPFWRFALPITSTEKSYRPTHRAGGARGAVAWDMSYMSTIGLDGPVNSLEKLLKAVGVTEQGLWEKQGEKWRQGKRSWKGWLTRQANNKTIQIGPSTVLWCPFVADAARGENQTTPKKAPKHQIFVRAHPAAFLETWTELLRLSKLQRPAIHIEDLRFEIGSIDITGPGSTEALLGILHPHILVTGDQVNHGETFKSLGGVTNPGSLPPNSILSFEIMDPRLRFPPRPVALPKVGDEEANFSLLETLSSWPVDASVGSSTLFDRDARLQATRLPSQKALNRRKSLAPPGAYASVLATDPKIPLTLLMSRTSPSAAAQGTWTLLVPWKCILPIWYGLMHYPLSTGGNPRFGGLEELRQIHFEHGIPWFPADFPGTGAGFAWEIDARSRRLAAWARRPKGKRTEWDSLDLGAGRKGEIGRGWASDFERLLGLTPLPDSIDKSMGTTEDTTQDTQKTNNLATKEVETPIEYLQTKAFKTLLAFPSSVPLPSPTVSTIRITLVSRGVATPCARIYNLPSQSSSQDSSAAGSPPSTTREEWLAQLPPKSTSKPLPNPKSKTARNLGRIPLNTPLPQRVRLLAQSLMQPRPYPAKIDEGEGHPHVPDEDDLIGFVTTGDFNLAEGKGVAVGTVSVPKILERVWQCGNSRARESRLCIVRNAGEKIGRLGRWEAV